MRKLVPIVAAVCFASVSMAEETPQSSKTPRTLVTVDGEALTELDFALFRAKRGGAERSPEAQMMLLNQLVNTTMLAKAARADGLDKLPEVATAAKIANNQVLAEVAIRNYLKSHPITDEDIQKAYEKHYVNEPTTEFKARHILVESQEKGSELIKELDGGADFSELAKKHSTGPTGKNGGDLGWFGAGQMVKPFSDAVAKLEKGKYAAEPVQTQFGWHVIQLDDQRQTPVPALDEVRATIVEGVQREKAATYMGEVREKTEVVVQEAFKKPEPKAAEAEAKATN